MRVLLADQHSNVRWALRMAIREEPELVVVGEAADASELESQACALKPDLVLFEWELPGRPPGAVLSELRTVAPRPRIVVLSQRSESEKVALASGADAFVSKAKEPDALLTVLRSMARP
jgi:DNA-binding NarL/FixJ family response regulator